MRPPVLVRGTTSLGTAVFFTLLAALFLALGGYFLAKNQPQYAYVLMPIGAGIFLIGIAVQWQQKRERLYLVDLGAGFRLIDHREEKEYADAEVVSVSQTAKEHFADGIYKHTDRQVRIWIASDERLPAEIVLQYVVKSGNSDPLASFLQRLSEKLQEAALRDFSSGKEVFGVGWCLHADRLEIEQKPEPLVLPLAQISKVDTMEEEICVWAQGKERAVFRVPAISANADLLLRVLTEYLEAHPPEQDTPLDRELGRLLFERKPGRSRLFIHIVASLAAGFVSFKMFEAVRRGDGSLLFLAMLFATVGLLWLCISCVRATQHYRFYEHGLVFTRWLHPETRMRYLEITALAFQATREFVQHLYVGTAYDLRLETMAHGKPIKLHYVDKIENQDKAMDEMRDRIANHLADRMQEQLTARKSVAWTRSLTLQAECLTYEKDAFIGRKQVRLPYASIQRWSLDAEFFYLWQRGTNSYVTREYHHVRNFYPGFYLLLRLLNPSKEDAGAASEGESATASPDS